MNWDRAERELLALVRDSRKGLLDQHTERSRSELEAAIRVPLAVLEAAAEVAPARLAVTRMVARRAGARHEMIAAVVDAQLVVGRVQEEVEGVDVRLEAADQTAAVMGNSGGAAGGRSGGLAAARGEDRRHGNGGGMASQLHTS